jgi:hypothetical protein
VARVFLVSCLSSSFIFTDLVDDAAGADDPLEGLGVLVVDPDVVRDSRSEFGDASEGPATDALSDDLGKPALDMFSHRRSWSA